MDILDIMLAKALTPQGQTEAYVAKANKAAQDAAKARDDADAAIASVTAAAEDIAAAQEAAEELLETAQSIQVNMPEAYSSTGQNTDGYMTQKATTDALALKADASALAAKADSSALAGKVDTSTLNSYATKIYVDQSIAAIPAEQGSVSNLGSENAGKMVVVGNDGSVNASTITEAQIRNLVLASDTFQQSTHVLGLEMDYENKVMTRLQEAAGKSAGTDFNVYKMYGGRKRCNVADDGTINAFYGEASYKEDGSNGQVMVYQPKFYYQRTAIKTESYPKGTTIRKERLFISDTTQEGFKLHPLFKDASGAELDYVLLPAYEGHIDNNKLCSIAEVQPTAYLNAISGEAVASARGTGWHMTTMQVESALQMLQMIEYGSLNGQQSLERGICDLERVERNISCITGSTANLGNDTGHATYSVSDGVTYNIDGKRAISYRGTENPWGNIWHTIGNALISGNNSQGGGLTYICTDFNYSSTLTNNYESIGFILPNSTGWISAMGLCTEKYDWVFVPIECGSSANSTMPVGDNIWVTSNLSGVNMMAIGGNWRHGESEGMFFYACDQAMDAELFAFGASTMFIPTKNATYTSNVSKWATLTGWSV